MGNSGETQTELPSPSLHPAPISLRGSRALFTNSPHTCQTMFSSLALNQGLANICSLKSSFIVTQSHLFIYVLSMAAFRLQLGSSVRDHMAAKPEIFSVWPFVKDVHQLLLLTGRFSQNPIWIFSEIHSAPSTAYQQYFLYISNRGFLQIQRLRLYFLLIKFNF